MELLIIGLLIISIVLASVAIVRNSGSKSKGDDTHSYIRQDVIELSRTVTELKDKLQFTLTDRLDQNQTLMRDTLAKQLSQSAKLVTDVTERLTKLDETNKRVVSVADELRTLQNVLQNPKQRGVLGEYFLQSVLENVLPPGRFSMQHKFKDGEIVDAVVRLEKGKILPIDSKFSLENYNRLVDETDQDKRDRLSKLIKSDLKQRIDETAKYIRPEENTMDFAFMFIPSEAVYYDLLINKIAASGVNARDLIEYAFQDKHVIIVSPTSFMAYLQTVMQGLRSLQIEEQAKEIQSRVLLLQRHIESHNAYMNKLGSSLATTVSHFNTAHNELKKVDKDVVKITATTSVVEPMKVVKPLDE